MSSAAALLPNYAFLPGIFYFEPLYDTYVIMV